MGHSRHGKANRKHRLGSRSAHEMAVCPAAVLDPAEAALVAVEPLSRTGRACLRYRLGAREQRARAARRAERRWRYRQGSARPPRDCDRGQAERQPRCRDPEPARATLVSGAGRAGTSNRARPRGGQEPTDNRGDDHEPHSDSIRAREQDRLPLARSLLLPVFPYPSAAPLQSIDVAAHVIVPDVIQPVEPDRSAHPLQGLGALLGLRERHDLIVAAVNHVCRNLRGGCPSSC